MNRRNFLALSASAPILLNNACGRINKPHFETFTTAANHRRPVDLSRYYPSPPDKTSNPLRILFLGGTNFLGPASVHWLTLRGHDVTLFNRGTSAPELFPNLVHVSGDRTSPESGYNKLNDFEPWDVVIDTWSKAPECVRDAAGFLKGKAKQYIYISSIAVYKMENYRKHGGITEQTPLPANPGLAQEQQTELDYATRKLLGDDAIREYWDSNDVTVLRPHLIPGPHQEKMNGVETYWPVRLQVGGDVLAPGDGKDPTQWVDVRDVAWFIGQCAEEGLTGIYNLGQQQTLSDLFDDLRNLSTAKSELRWVSWPDLQRIGAGPFHELPMYVPRQEGSFYNISDAKARAAGLTYRKARDVYPLVLEDHYYQYGNRDFVFGLNGEPGLSPAREQELLSKVRL